jgi:hypothetical protein
MAAPVAGSPVNPSGYPRLCPLVAALILGAMNRARPFRALIASLALLAFVPESVWAAACLPGMGTAHEQPAGHGAAAHAPDGAGHPHPAERDDSPHHGEGTCPFTAGSGCTAASLPSSGAALSSALSAAPSAPVLPGTGQDRLIVTFLFHPPRA